MPDTSGYMVLGYALTVIILVLLVVYLVVKARNLQAEIKTLESIENENQAESPRAQTPAQSNVNQGGQSQVNQSNVGSVQR